MKPVEKYCTYLKHGRSYESFILVCEVIKKKILASEIKQLHAMVR